jgi:predicted site-specific integrase-resolvase
MENKVPNLLITLSEFRIMQWAKEGLPKLLLSFIFLIVLNSCSKEAALDEVMPSSVEATLVLKEWATKNDKLNQANLIEWDHSTPISISDSIKGYAAPVKTASGYKEFITFELRGKRYGWYKSYQLLNSTDMEIVIQTAEGKTVRSGFIRKKSATAPKGKSTSIREMNLEEEEEIVYDTWLDWVTISAPRLNSGGGGGFYFGNTRFDMNIFNYYMQAGLFNAGYYGGGNSLYGFVDYNYTELESKLTNPCFQEVLAELKKNNVYGKISEIIQKFDFKKQGLKYSVTINENTADEDTNLIEKNAYVRGNIITLNSIDLKSASKEYIARVIIHEILHVYINNRFGSTDHQEMLNDYVDEIAMFLNKLYQTKEEDAKILSLLGLQKEKGCYPFLLKDLGISEWDVYNTDQKYKNQNYGKHCN